MGTWLLSLSEVQSAQPKSGDNTMGFIGINSDSVSKCFAPHRIAVLPPSDYGGAVAVAVLWLTIKCEQEP